jgi:hypothetical protein
MDSFKEEHLFYVKFMVACSASGTLPVGKYHKWSLNLPRERLIKGGGLGQEVLQKRRFQKGK